ncbi:O-antigen ligase family protein [Pseudomonas reactans]|uniref:O-antigen ligase family protein n=1 Tax=Pseudomonas reactans TaxID=117680 RepID=A0ABX2QQ76_9PSED|nr:O-antigen ligase family protein [Pseudomonas reactans]NWA42836.1 O-antigen ligase family protein [Pseudomonas reactans]NWC85708.1 O-antigen ligase family protein [Pseudomonas reactans]NWD29731.1 O-antigen ligase family protein [Pseudomonas reactans]NWD93887.1 O-antigen ligase family protein [Pseudomonas reactans]NWF14116.1 O-antigen ligase family protein [Pseudomonas reactans]
MQASRWAQVWMVFGLLWFLLAIAFAPTNKIYQQGLTLFLWLPAMVFAWSARERLKEVWRSQRWICLMILLMAIWGGISLLWTNVEDPSREAKRLLYVGVFLLFFPVLADGRTDRIIRVLQWGGYGLALSSLIAIIKFYGIEHREWSARLAGLGQLSHPILGAYVIGVAAVWMLHWLPRGRWMQVAWAVAIGLLGLFVVLSQSRGAAVALLLSVVAMPLWCRDRRTVVTAAGAIVAAVAVFIAMESLMLARGVSYRPQIFMEALRMIAERPWTGLGLGGDYKVFTEGQYFDHSHNLFTHVTIELGLPGLLLWCAVWFGVLWQAWKARGTDLGKGILGIWVFSFLAMQFDAASLTGTPRAEWFITWLPIALASVLVWARANPDACDKVRVLPNQ